MRRFALLAVSAALVLAAACSPDFDPCEKVTGLCVTLRVEGPGKVDQLRIAASGAVSGERTTSRAALSLPVRVGLDIPAGTTGTARFDVTGEYEANVIGTGTGQITLPAEHSLTVVLAMHADGGVDLESPADLSRADDLAVPADLTTVPDLTPTDPCTNGVDDDGDALVDCADPKECPSFACVAEAPTDWNGPVSLYNGPTTGAPTCGDAFPTVAWSGGNTPNAAAVSCRACSCNMPGLGSIGCCPNRFDYFASGNTSCAGAPSSQKNWSVNQQEASCLSSVAGAGSVRLLAALCSDVNSAPVPCSVNQTTAVTMRPDPTWTTSAVLCAPSADARPAGCGGGTMCQPKAATPFGETLCYWKTGDVACPNANLVKVGPFYDAFTDARDCAACSCGTLSGGNVTCNIDVKTCDLGCCDGSQSFNLGGVGTNSRCVASPQGTDGFWNRTAATAYTGGTCGPQTGGTATGAVTPNTASAITVCCNP